MKLLGRHPGSCVGNVFLTTTQNCCFNVHKDFASKVSVWIELPYHSLLMENSRRKLVRALGSIFNFVQEDESSSYSHNWACILRDTTRPTPRQLKIRLDSDHYVQQEVIFKNLPTLCQFCGSLTPLGFDCLEDPHLAPPIVSPPSPQKENPDCKSTPIGQQSIGHHTNNITKELQNSQS